LNNASVEEPVTVAFTPVLGLMVRVFVELAAGFEINIGKVSDGP
jgi:hypothetical protein